MATKMTAGDLSEKVRDLLWSKTFVSIDLHIAHMKDVGVKVHDNDVVRIKIATTVFPNRPGTPTDEEEEPDVTYRWVTLPLLRFTGNSWMDRESEMFPILSLTSQRVYEPDASIIDPTDHRCAGKTSRRIVESRILQRNALPTFM